MKKTIKKILALTMSLCLMASFTVGASAASYTGTRDDQTIALNMAPNGYGNLNIYGNETVYNNANVVVWEPESSDPLAQRWGIEHKGVASNGDPFFRIYSKLNNRYALNVDRRSGQNWNCTMYEYSGNEQDAIIEFNYHDLNGTLDRIIWLSNYDDMYLYANNYTNGSNVRWVSGSANGISRNMQWSMIY